MKTIVALAHSSPKTDSKIPLTIYPVQNYVSITLEIFHAAIAPHPEPTTH